MGPGAKAGGGEGGDRDTGAQEQGAQTVRVASRSWLYYRSLVSIKLSNSSVPQLPLLETRMVTDPSQSSVAHSKGHSVTHNHACYFSKGP